MIQIDVDVDVHVVIHRDVMLRYLKDSRNIDEIQDRMILKNSRDNSFDNDPCYMYLHSEPLVLNLPTIKDCTKHTSDELRNIMQAKCDEHKAGMSKLKERLMHAEEEEERNA